MSGSRHDGAPRTFRGRSTVVRYNPVVTADGVRWRDYELAAEAHTGEWRPAPVATHDSGTWHAMPAHDSGTWHATPAREEVLAAEAPPPPWPGPVEDWFDMPGRPPRLDTCRPYGTPGGLAWPDPQLQRDLCQVLPPGARFPDPRGAWIRLVNGEGPGEDPFRATNALDCALAVISTWHGEPMVAAPRLPEYDRLGRPSLTGEAGGVARAERWLGHRFEYVGQGRRAYTAIAQRLRTGGHGASAVLVTRWPSGGAHAWNAVNSAGAVVWVDAQRGHTSVDAPRGPVTGVFCVVTDRRGRRL
ncbi:toxin glutamine deamidase domain-containing protein [Sphaerisporangium sp. NPDC051011]|uniref:toxin glutamine deamidase domain-containing protein n=1 Tax=Sphaerisporangium sp. NPDC051011 TaxID=3155792 RepID=UPI0033ECF1E5